MQSGMSCILPRRTWAALLYLLIPGIPEPNQASIRRSRTVSFSRSSHPDEQSMILKKMAIHLELSKRFLIFAIRNNGEVTP